MDECTGGGVAACLLSLCLVIISFCKCSVVNMGGYHLADEQGGECQDVPGEADFGSSSERHLCGREDGELADDVMTAGDELRVLQICGDNQKKIFLKKYILYIMCHSHSFIINLCYLKCM